MRLGNLGNRRALAEAHSSIERMNGPATGTGFAERGDEPQRCQAPGAHRAELARLSYDLKHGLDVVELPTSLPVDVLDRLFSAPGK